MSRRTSPLFGNPKVSLRGKGKPQVAPAHDLVGAIPVDESRLTPDTSPEAIAAGRRAEVAALLAEHPAASPGWISAHLYLPLDAVERALKELGRE